MKKYDGKIKSLLKKSKGYTFLVGAGISMEYPSNLPSAREFVKSMVELCTPSEYINKILSLETLRFEFFIEVIKNRTNIDKNVNFLDYFDIVKSPNLIHLFLANMIIEGKGKHHIITTNFDYLIEYALMDLLPASERDNILSIITKDDFEKNKNYGDLYDLGKYPLCKIHGSKKNIITNMDTSESLVVDIAALGKDRAEGETFAIEPYKKPIISNIMKGQALIVMGYSGSDAFDISPMLQELEEITMIIWIDHSQEKQLEIFHFEQKEPQKESLSDIENFLSTIHTKKGCDIYLIKGNTKDVISTYFDPILLKGKSINHLEKTDIPSNSTVFKEWLKDSENYKNIPDHVKYQFAGFIINELREPNVAIESYKKGLELLPEGELKSKGNKSTFLNNIGMIYRQMGDYDNALKYYDEALSIAKQIGDLKGTATRLSNIGRIYFDKGDLDKALEYFNEAVEIDQKLGEFVDLDGKATRLNNIGMVYQVKEDYDNALKYLKEVLKIDEKAGNLKGKANTLGNIGLNYKLKLDYVNAYNYYNEAFKIDEQLGNLRGKATTLNNIARIFEETGYSDKALSNYIESIELAEQIGDINQKAISLNNLGILYFKGFNDVKNAISHMEQALELFKKQGLFQNVNQTQNDINFLKEQLNK
jgi:tetratricopeptide (TPR) repeat protein